MSCKMHVSTDVLDVLPDRTITRLKLKTEPMAVTIRRDEPDENFMIEMIDVADQDCMEEATKVMAAHLHEYCIFSIDINCADGSKSTLRI